MKKSKIIITGIVLIIVVIFLLVIIFMLKGKNNKENDVDEEISVEDLKVKFNEMFKNEGNEYISLKYEINEEKNKKYKIVANIPEVHISKEADSVINKEINDIFIKKILEICNDSNTYTKFNMDYAIAVNNNIISIAIKCTIKEGTTTQRTIIKTYNFDKEKNKFIDILQVVPKNKKDEIQNLIKETIEKEKARAEVVSNQGYKAYNRDIENKIYNLENSSEFYIKDNILYIIYCYGNNNYTGEVDLVITTI